MDLRAKDFGIIQKLVAAMRAKIIRLIAFEVRPRRIAYVVFETPSYLLDWGIRSVRLNLPPSAAFTNILKTYHPSVFVLRRVEAGGRRDNPRTKELLSAIQTEAKRLAVTVAFLTERQLELFFRRHGRVTKHQIALAIGEWFPELSAQVPPARKPWQPEHWRTLIFDAVATAAVYLAGEQINPNGG
jgi:hypothetical protein